MSIRYAAAAFAATMSVCAMAAEYTFDDFTLERREDRANVLERTRDGFRLDGTAGVKRFKKESKTYEVKVTCRGKGRVRVFVPEYTYATEKRAHCVAYVMEVVCGDEFKEKSDFFDVQPWHPASHLEFYLDAVGDVEIKSASCTPVTVAAASKERAPTVFTIPLAGEPMVFDGVFRRDWWNKWGVTLENGYRDIFSGNVYPRQSEVSIAADADNLYVAVLHPVPPGGVVCNVKEHDGQVWFDENVEFGINPDASDTRPRHMYQIISNFRGVTYDIDNDLAIGQFYKEWTCKGYEARRASREKEEKGRDDYILIVRLPFKSVGIADPTKAFGVNFGRGFANPLQSASIQGASYTEPKTLVRCRVMKGAPAVTWRMNDPDGEGRYAATLEVRGGTVAGEASVVSKAPEERRAGAFGGGKDFSATIDLRDRVLPSGLFVAEVRGADGEVLFAQERPVDTASYSPKTARINGAAREMKLSVEHYPFMKKLNLRWAGISEAAKAALAGAEAVVTTPSGRKLKLEKPDISYRSNCANIKFDFEADEYGEFSAEARAFGRDGRTLAEGKGSFPWKKLEWHRNDLGKDDVVVRPYTPLRVSGQTVSCLLRDTAFGDSGLPASIVAAGGEVLAAPAEFVLETEAGEVKPSGAKLRFTKKTPTRVEFSAETSFPGLKVKLDAWMEYDGVVWYDMTLSPERPVAVKRLSLRIPYAGATLMHYFAESVRGEKHYFELAKELPGQGKIWNSVPYKGAKYHSPFMPFVWLGDNRRGLMWFAESDEGWVNDAKSETYDLVRGADGRHSLSVNFVAMPTTLSAPRRIRFGLLANPLKPVKTGAELTYKWTYTGGTGACQREAEFFDFHMANKVIGDTPDSSWVFYLAGQQYVKGDSEMKYVYNEFARYPRAAYTLSLPGVKYRCHGFESDNYLPIVFDWTDEFVDFLVWRMDVAMRNTRLDGIYMDNSYISMTVDDMKTRRVWYVRDDGKVQPGCDIMKMREMFKRMSVLAQKYGKRLPRIVIHNTGSQVLPRFTFAELAFGGEMNIPKRENGGDHFSVFDSAWAETMLGVDWGFTRGMLTMLASQSGDEKQTRAMYACYRIYDMALWNNGLNGKVYKAFREIDKDFGTNADDCTFTLWRDQKLVGFADKSQGVRVSYYARPGKKLLYMANQDKADHEVVFTLAEKGVLTDAETGKAIAPRADGSYSVAIEGHDLKALLLAK